MNTDSQSHAAGGGEKMGEGEKGEKEGRKCKIRCVLSYLLTV